MQVGSWGSTGEVARRLSHWRQDASHRLEEGLVQTLLSGIEAAAEVAGIVPSVDDLDICIRQQEIDRDLLLGQQR